MELLIVSFVTFIASLFATYSQLRIDWCEVERRYCSGKKHIACEPNSFAYNDRCKNASLLPMSAAQKNLIVHLHNHYRNEIAGGRIKKFPEAKRMGEMKWDDTLQHLAGVHAKHCTFAHDECRAPPQYPYSGRNIFYQATLGYVPNATDAIERGLKGWFEEWQEAKPSLVDKLTADQTQVFHFTVMSHDKNNRVGCAMIEYLAEEQQSKTPFDAFLLTCNYEYTNVLNEPMYEKGKACSSCPSGCSPIYKALCKV